jgi:hypothetical protein
MQLHRPGLTGTRCKSLDFIIHRLSTDLVIQGNAVDAMIGTTFCVGVIGMYHSGIGGGGFMLVRDKGGQYEAIDFRESAPAAAYEDMYQGNVNGSIYGGLSVGVPGEVRGFEYAHKKYGVRIITSPGTSIKLTKVDRVSHGRPSYKEPLRLLVMVS